MIGRSIDATLAGRLKHSPMPRKAKRLRQHQKNLERIAAIEAVTMHAQNPDAPVPPPSRSATPGFSHIQEIRFRREKYFRSGRPNNNWAEKLKPRYRDPPPELYVLPEQWTPEHVERRMRDAFNILLRLPIRVKPRAFGSAMPEYALEFSDLVEIDPAALRARNRLLYRASFATSAEIHAMEEALAWPLDYHLDRDAAWCLSRGAWWRAIGRRQGEALEAHKPATLSLPGYKTWFHKHRRRGAETLADALALAAVPVA